MSQQIVSSVAAADQPDTILAGNSGGVAPTATSLKVLSLPPGIDTTKVFDIVVVSGDQFEVIRVGAVGGSGNLTWSDLTRNAEGLTPALSLSDNDQVYLINTATGMGLWLNSQASLTSGKFLTGIGSADYPSFAFLTAPNTGFRQYADESGTAVFVGSGVDIMAFNVTGLSIHYQTVFAWCSNIIGTAIDTMLGRVGPGSIGLSGLPNGQALNIRTLTELTTLAAAATTDTAIQIPENAILLAVSTRTVAGTTTATTYTVTGTTSSTVFSTTPVSLTPDSTDPGTAAGAFFNATGQTIRLTPNTTPGNGNGRVRVTIMYLESIPPTS